jgi:N-acyl-D-aspartate/D-glutamate deacylase
VLGEVDKDPTSAQLEQMKGIVKTAMEEGALGVGASLIYAPGTYAETDELVAISSEAARCGGSYIAHMRSEGDRLLEAVDETIDIARRAQIPVEIYHLKAAGKSNWDKLDQVISRIDKARAEGLHVTTDMYTYTAGATGLDAAMPTWVQDGGQEAWVKRLKDPKIRARVLAEMRAPGKDWENLFLAAGSADNILLIGFKTEKLKPLTGKRLSEVAKMRGKSPEDTAIDLVIEDGTRIETVYFLMSEDNVRKQIQLPYMSFGSDAESSAPEGVFLQSSTHPRAYGNVARLLGRYVRDEKAHIAARGRAPSHLVARGQSRAQGPRPAEGRAFRGHRRVRSRDDPGSRDVRETPAVLDGRVACRDQWRSCAVEWRADRKGDWTCRAWAGLEGVAGWRLPRLREGLACAALKVAHDHGSGAGKLSARPHPW